MKLPVTASEKQFFRSVDQLEGTPEFNEFLEREFPVAASEFPEGVSRRRWMQLMGASVAFAGASGCRYYREEFAGFVVPPSGRVAGLPQSFATNFVWAGKVVNGLVKSLDGRPIKVDGNAMHPMFATSANSGYADGKDEKFAQAGSDAATQAAVLSLYDPDRLGWLVQRDDRSLPAGKMVTVAESVAQKKGPVNWTDFDIAARSQLETLGGNGGEGLAIVYEPAPTPTFNRLLAEVAAKFPKATLVPYESVYGRNAVKGLESLGVSNVTVNHRLDKATVIVAIDADLFGSESASVINARQFSINRDPNGGNMNRLYCIESQFSTTGSAADFRYALQSSQMVAFLKRLEAAIDAGTPFEASAEELNYSKLSPSERLERVLQVIATDLLANKGKSLVTVGYQQDPAAHQIAMRINAKLENVGKTLFLLDAPNELAGLKSIKLDEFARQAANGQFNTAWIFAPNPVYTVAGDIDLPAALLAIKTVVYAADYDDETAVYSTWSLPLTHPLEAWSDVRSADGTYGVCQPMIEPVTGARSSIELLSILAGFEELDPAKIVSGTLQKLAGGSFTERLWQEALHDGFLKDSQYQVSSATINTAAEDLKPLPASAIAAEGENGSEPTVAKNEVLFSDPDNVDLSRLEVVVLPSDTVYDGRLANNGWMQECPQPITKLTWDNAALMSVSTARALGVGQSRATAEMVVIRQGDAMTKLPIFIVPGQAEGTIVVALGYGRSRAGSVGGVSGQFDVGHSIQGLRRWNQAFILNGIEVSGTTEPYKLATTQDHFAIEDQLGMGEIPRRAQVIVREGTLASYEKDHQFAKVSHHGLKIDSLWKEPEVRENHAWGMSIDLNKCSGCNACVIACQAENNVPIVGKEQVSRGREMHWLRIDRYFTADREATAAKGDSTNPVDPRIVTQPMACAHCETAPCEQVCPVAATVHTEDGINAMAYNRCVGTRYCANNCPYKVRRFNYFNYNQKYGYFYGWQDKRETANTKLQSLVLNPDVTVRGRGVMEKCTYCVQRVQNAKIMARNKGGVPIADGDVRTACQEACASQAIVFGDLNDKTSRVYANHNDPRSYAVLEELNIKPRTQYLARLRNVPVRLMTSEQLNPTWNHSHSEHGEEHHGDEHGHDHEEHAGEHEEAHS